MLTLMTFVFLEVIRNAAGAAANNQETLRCVVHHPEAEQTFEGVGSKWVGVEHAIADCLEYAADNGLDGSQCTVVGCHPVDA